MKKSEVSEDESDDEIFNLEEMENKKFKKFNIDRNNYQLKFKNLPNNFDPCSTISGNLSFGAMFSTMYCIKK